MPIRAALDSQTRVFRTTLTGTVTLTDLSQHLATVQTRFFGRQRPRGRDTTHLPTNARTVKLTHF